LYPSSNIYKAIESRKMSWGRHVARTDATRGAYEILMGKSEGRRELEDFLIVDGGIVLNVPQRRVSGSCGLD